MEIYENRKNAKERLFDDFNRTKNEDEIKKAGVIENEHNEIEPATNYNSYSEHSVNNFNNNISNMSNILTEDSSFNSFGSYRKKETLDNNSYKNNDLVASKVENEKRNNHDLTNESSSISDFYKKEEPIVKEVKLGNTIISSDTRELNFNVNDELQEKTVEIETTKSMEKKEGLNTEIIDSIKNIVENVPSETIVIKNEESKDNKVEKVNEVRENNKPTPTLENVESVTEKLLKMKISSDIDATQLIDTARVRDSISSDREEIPVTPEFANMYKKVFGTDVAEVRKTKEEVNAKLNASSTLQPVGMQDNISVFENNSKSNIPEVKYKYIGTVFETYIIIEIKNEMYMIDKSAANERIVYETVRNNYYDESVNDSQMLLLADIVTVSNKQMSIARQNRELFIKAGFDFDEFGDNTIKLMAVPGMCEDMNTKKLFLEILDEMDTVAITEENEKEAKFVATVAYKTAAKNKLNLTEDELQSMIKHLLSLENPFICPYGKQVAIKLTKEDLEKKFSRR